MPVALLSTLWSLRYLILSVVVIGAFTWYTVHERNIGAAKCLAAVEQATAQEHERRIEIGTWLAPYIKGVNEIIDNLSATNAQLMQRSKRLSVANNDKICFDAGAIDRLRGVQRR